MLGDSDELFSRFIVIGLPVGLSGLVVAGLLACAMSALSAGINSTCSVITIDILDRLRGRKNRAAASESVKSLKYVSVFVGVVVVLLSLLGRHGAGQLAGEVLQGRQSAHGPAGRPCSSWPCSCPGPAVSARCWAPPADWRS